MAAQKANMEEIPGRNSEEVPAMEPDQSGDEKKGKYYLASDAMKNLVDKVISQCHAHLKEAKIEIFMKSGDWYDGDLRKHGDVDLVNAKEKVHTDADFRLLLNEELFSMGTPEQQEALLDDLLARCTYHENERTGVWVWKKRKPVIQAFTEVVARRGMFSQSLRDLEVASKQVPLFGTDNKTFN